MATILNLSRKSSTPSTSSAMAGPTKSPGIRIPAWAFARRLSDRNLKVAQGSPDSLAKHTIQTMPSVDDDDDSLLLPQMTGTLRPAVAAKMLCRPQGPSTSTAVLPKPMAPLEEQEVSQVILKMDVTGFQARDLHVDVDTRKKQLCLSGMGPRMFKRAFPLPTFVDNEDDMARLQASIVVDDTTERLYLTVRSGRDGESQDDDDDSSAASLARAMGRHSLIIKDETRPPMSIMFNTSGGGTE